MSTPGGELLGEAHIDIDMDVDSATRALREFGRDADRQLRETGRRFEQETDIWTRELAAIRGTPLDVDTRPAEQSLHEFGEGARRELEETSNRFETEGRRISQSLERSTQDTDRFGISLRGLARVAPVLARVGLAIGAVGAAAGSSLPLVAGLVTALENIAPAATVAATGLLAISQASAVVKLSMVGVGDAVTAAFNTSDKGAKKFDESLKKLAPSAREFALTVRDLAPAFTRFQQSIQNTVFTGFSGALEKLSTSVLPVLKTNLSATAVTLNTLALGAAAAATQLSTSGTLGVAMAGANAGLKNLSGLPAQVVTALGQLAAAGAPAFDRLTNAAAGVATKISGKLSEAFKSGALEDSVNTAIDVLKDLGGIIGNVFGTLKNVLDAAGAAGGGTFQVLTSITQALQDATATKGFQEAIGALVQTMGVLGQTLGPLIGEALAALGPVLVALAAPTQILIEALGSALTPIIQALGPVLEAAAEALGALVTAVAPLLPVIGTLVGALLPALTPLFDVLTTTFTQLAPIVAQVGTTLAAVLAPIIASLPAILQPLIDNISQVSAAILPLASQVLTALTPALVQLGGAVAELAVALAPVLVLVSGLAARLLVKLMPIITPLITLVGKLASVLASILAGAITNVVVPAINIITSLLTGRFTAAGKAVTALVTGIGRQFATTFRGVRTAVSTAITTAIGLLKRLPGQVKSALAGAGKLLVSAGREIVRGLINGIGSMAGALKQKALSLASSVKDSISGALGISSPSRVMIALGRFIGDGLIKGLTQSAAGIKAAAKRLAQLLRDAVESKGISRRENSLLRRVARDSAQLKRLASDRDKIAGQLKNANAKLQAIEQKYAQVRSSIADQILSSGAIVQQGTAPVDASGLLASLRASVKAAQDFQKALATLKARGLRADLLEQIASAGVEAGSATATALVNATPGQISAINKAQGQLASIAKKTGTTVADALYKAGIKAAQGLVDGLASQEAAIQKQMDKIARGMIRAIKKALKIKSPSRVAQSLGGNFGDGLVRGLEQSLTPVKVASDRLSDAVGMTRTSGPGAPVTLSQSAATALVAANRSLPVSVAAPRVTVMIGNRVVDEHVRVIVDRANEDAARQQLQGVRR